MDTPVILRPVDGLGNKTGRYRFNASEMRLEKISDRVPGVSTDTFFKEPYFEPHLADDKNPKGQMVHSKKHKSRLMKEQGVHERGDRVHGAR